ncbi:MAG: hypothetical protein WC856_18960 [Methylococcaceae bacterium]
MSSHYIASKLYAKIMMQATGSSVSEFITAKATIIAIVSIVSSLSYG